MNRESHYQILRKVSSGGCADIGDDGWTDGLDRGIRRFFATMREAPKSGSMLFGHEGSTNCM